MLTDKQQIYDIVKQGILAQNAFGYESRCVYKTSGGLKCAAGMLIPDEKYHQKFEKLSFSEINDELGLVDEKLLGFVEILQRIHDGCAMKKDFERFISRMESFAKKSGLKP